METVRTLTALDEGCELGLAVWQGRASADVVSILAFGKPVGGGGVPFGASLFGNGGATTEEIAAAVVAYANGFALCSAAAPAAHLRIGVGTSNFGSQVSAEHGRAWGAMVESINAQLASGFSGGRVDAAGADDIEPDWSSPATARAWLDGYRQGTSRPFLNFGAASGCPQTTSSGGACNNGWTQADVWSVSSGNTQVVPQIYAESGANARQWRMLSAYAQGMHGARLDIVGALTQLQACIDVGATCAGTRNAPAQGWAQLYDQLNADPSTAQALPWSTDIRWKMTGPLHDIGVLDTGLWQRPSVEKRALLARLQSGV